MSYLNQFTEATTLEDTDLLHLKRGTGANSDKRFTGATIKSYFATAAQGAKVNLLTVTVPVNLDTIKTKTDFLTVTQPVDLDTIETRVNALDAAVVLKGSWDASVGTFPGGGTAQTGDSYIVSVAGTVDSINFSINDRIVALIDNAPTGVYATNWLKLDYSDAYQTNVEIEAAYNAQVAIVSQAIAEAGTSTDVYRWTPERVKQAIEALGGTSGGGGGLLPEFKTANFTAEAGKIYFCDTTAGAITATLPAGVDQANIGIVDAGGACSTNPVTINPNGAETIHNDTTFGLDQNFGQVNAAYKAADTNWQVALVGYPEVIVGSGTALEAEIDARVVAIASGRRAMALTVGVGWGDGTGTPVVVDNATIGQVGWSYIDLPANANTKLFLMVPMPPSWDGAEDLVVEIAWLASDANAGNVLWWVAAGAMTDADVLTSGFQTNNYTALDAAPGATTTFNKVSISISNTAPDSTAGDWLGILVQRRGGDATDTYESTVRFLGAQLTYTTNAPTDD